VTECAETDRKTVPGPGEQAGTGHLYIPLGVVRVCIPTPLPGNTPAPGLHQHADTTVDVRADLRNHELMHRDNTLGSDGQ